MKIKLKGMMKSHLPIKGISDDTGMYKYCNMGMHWHIRGQHFMCTGPCVNGFKCPQDNCKRTPRFGIVDYFFFLPGLQLICSLEAAFKELQIKNLMMSFLFFLATVSYFTLFSHMDSSCLMPSYSCISTLLPQSISFVEDNWNLPGTPLPRSRTSAQLRNCEVYSN